MYTIYVCQENYEKYKEDKMEDRALGNKLLFQTLYFWKLSFVGLQCFL